MQYLLTLLKISGLLIISSLLFFSCCIGGSSCNDQFPAFSIRFLKQNGNYYFFKDTVNISIKIFDNDSTFLDLLKEETVSGDSMLIRFFAYPDRDVFEYNVLANDTLIGTINLEYQMQEYQCCDNSLEVSNLIFNSMQEHSTQFGSLDIILDN